MKKNANEIFMLQYQIKRYQAMGNGTMCQTLNGIYIITLQGISVDGREIRMQSEFVVGANH